MVKGWKSVLGLAAISAAYSGTALADGFFLGRASLSPGFYSTEVSANGVSIKGDGLLVAGDLGATLGFKLGGAGSPVILLDSEIELATVASNAELPNGSQVGTDFEKTDTKLTVGIAIPAGNLSITPFAGARLSWQGNGMFGDDLYKETGFFVGAGLSGIKVGGDVKMSISAAYNATELEDGIITGKVDADGYSAKVTFRKTGSAHGYSLKYQTFETDRDATGADLTEGYLLASLTWYFAQGSM
ncbi:MAG: hypothetical protein ACSHXK_15980 [Oceanococcus sp.]